MRRRIGIGRARPLWMFVVACTVACESAGRPAVQPLGTWHVVIGQPSAGTLWPRAFDVVFALVDPHVRSEEASSYVGTILPPISWNGRETFNVLGQLVMSREIRGSEFVNGPNPDSCLRIDVRAALNGARDSAVGTLTVVSRPGEARRACSARATFLAYKRP